MIFTSLAKSTKSQITDAKIETATAAVKEQLSLIASVGSYAELLPSKENTSDQPKMKSLESKEKETEYHEQNQ